MNNKKRNLKIIKLLAAVVFSLCILSYVSGCSIVTLIEESYSKKESVEKVPHVEIDEDEINSIIIVDEEMKKSYDIETDISLPEIDSKDPFKPFYVKDEEEEENVLILEKIYSEDGISYAEIKFNDNLYELEEDDPFGDNNYQVKVINPTSVVLLKGDEIITIFINQVYYD